MIMYRAQVSEPIPLDTFNAPTNTSTELLSPFFAQELHCPFEQKHLILPMSLELHFQLNLELKGTILKLQDTTTRTFEKKQILPLLDMTTKAPKEKDILN